MRLRDYQRTACRKIYNAIAAEKSKATICAMPTGVGKSLVNADFAGGIVTAFPGQRILCVTHSQILVGQNAEKMRELMPNIPFGVVSAGLGRREYGYPVTFAGIGSVYRAPEKLGKINIVLVDECHAISDKDKTMYAKLFDGLRKLNPNLVIIGLSATPYRMGMGLLTEGDTFTDVCVDMTTPEWIDWFVQEGFLVPLVARKTKTFIDTSDVAIVAGDFQKSGLSNAAMRGDMTEKALSEALPALTGRKSIAIYCVSIEHVEQVVMALDAEGIDCEFVHSKRSDDENDGALKRFGRGETRFIASMGQLTTGWDCPRLDCIIMLRPTRSPGLWVQMLGRGTRPMYCLDAYEVDGAWIVPDLDTTSGRRFAIAQSQKHDCLVLDFARNTEEMGPFDDPRLPNRRGKGGGEPIMKACQKGRMVDQEYIGCGRYAWAAERHCKDCGYEFYFEVKFADSTSGAAIMTGKSSVKPYVEPEVANFPVSRVTYNRHTKIGKPDSIRVTYYCGPLRQFKTYLCPDHGGGATARAKQWWRKHIDQSPPHGIETWLERMDEAAVPSEVRVRLKKDYPDVVDWIHA